MEKTATEAVGKTAAQVVDYTNADQLVVLVTEQGTSIAMKVVAAILIFLVGRWLVRVITGFARTAFRKANMEDTLEKFLCNMLHAVLLVVVIIAAIGALGVQTTSLLAVLGAAGLAVGLALQGSLSNFASGVLIVAFRPYKVGDFIEAAGVAGTVKEVQIFTTIIHSPDNKKILVPNSQIMSGTITNYSANDTRRIDLIVACSYGDDLDKVRKVLNEIVAGDERILKDPAPTIEVVALADNSVNFVVRPWVNSSDYWGVHFHVTEQVKKRFDESGLNIPFPQRDVHLYQHGAAS
ncbi:MAG: mechanosensitive ion channel [Rhodobacteraceae bacterium]|uniref:mechanosensitive ion channel family protein n=1 Tax=Accumulibacter sp. TaxID=2053492 RepID=UPI0019ECBF79|nr:mechanosensitive ion channel domain-containing protein [Accumulibacter sp.]MBE2257243.1 mechanosensitive ion channel [Paracoccaceae bacterium]MCB1942654.1 mechanosensitive ion channel [Accumulibacter sp.]